VASLEQKTAGGHGMKNRIAIWAAMGFLIACCFVLFTLLTPPQYLSVALRAPAGEALSFASCPVAFAVGRQFPLAFWWVPPINAGTYALIGLIAELLRRRSNLNLAT
jgi:hypothetical protein